jgi:5'-3' exonuclease
VCVSFLRFCCRPLLSRCYHWARSQIQIRSGPEGETLRNEAGEETSHLQGLFYRTINMLDKGIKPVFVFDGKPPELKKGEVSIGRSSNSSH